MTRGMKPLPPIVFRAIAGVSLLLMFFLPVSVAVAAWAWDWRWLLTGVMSGLIGLLIGWLLSQEARR